MNVLDESERVRVLVFPAGSEIGMEVNRSLGRVKEVDLFGANSSDDHAEFAFSRPIFHLPFVNEENFILSINELVTEESIDMIYPTMDSVLLELSRNKDNLDAIVIGSPLETNEIVCSKKKTYEALRSKIRCPKMYPEDELDSAPFPLFVKPDYGYGSRGAKLVHTRKEISDILSNQKGLLFLENLPGTEYTVDCFTDFKGNLLYCSPRERKRIQRGISVRSELVEKGKYEFEEIARIINQEIKINGAWFFQVKKSSEGEFCLLEIATRIGGSSGINHILGVNLPLLSVLNHLRKEIKIIKNSVSAKYDRALNSKIKLGFEFENLYIDFDDCLYSSNSGYNPSLMSFISSCKNRGKSVYLITRHQGDIQKKIAEIGLENFFNEIIHIRNERKKSEFMNPRSSVLIDDSFTERIDAIESGIPAFGPEAVVLLE